jgi:hypothetical protein
MSITKSEFESKVSEYLQIISKTRGTENKYEATIILYDFLVIHKNIINKHFSKLKDVIFRKFTEFLNLSFINERKERLLKLRLYKHTLFPHSKLDNEDRISEMLFNLIKNKDLSFIIVLYLEPDTHHPSINHLITILNNLKNENPEFGEVRLNGDIMNTIDELKSRN